MAYKTYFYGSLKFNLKTFFLECNLIYPKYIVRQSFKVEAQTFFLVDAYNFFFPYFFKKKILPGKSVYFKSFLFSYNQLSAFQQNNFIRFKPNMHTTGFLKKFVSSLTKVKKCSIKSNASVIQPIRNGFFILCKNLYGFFPRTESIKKKFLIFLKLERPILKKLFWIKQINHPLKHYHYYMFSCYVAYSFINTLTYKRKFIKTRYNNISKKYIYRLNVLKVIFYSRLHSKKKEHKNLYVRY